MSYYERLVRDPEAALGEIAARRNLSREELLKRFDAIRVAADSGKHLTLSQANTFFEQGHPPAELAKHVDDCPYCQEMLNGLHPERIHEGAESLQMKLQEARRRRSSDATLQPFEPGNRWPRWLPVAAISFGSAASVALVFSLVWARVNPATQELASLRNEIELLRTEQSMMVSTSVRPVSSLSRLSGLSGLVEPDAVSSGIFTTVRSEHPLAMERWTVRRAPNGREGTELELTRADGGKKPAPQIALVPGADVFLMAAGEDKSLEQGKPQ